VIAVLIPSPICQLFAYIPMVINKLRDYAWRDGYDGEIPKPIYSGGPIEG
jgi:hypothetical protein